MASLNELTSLDAAEMHENSAKDVKLLKEALASVSASRK